MDYLEIPSAARPGDFYLVDLGKLIPVLATTPHDAYELASLSVFGPGREIPPKKPVLYRLDEWGEVLEVLAA